jgi:hypothetical protein
LFQGERLEPCTVLLGEFLDDGTRAMQEGGPARQGGAVQGELACRTTGEALLLGLLGRCSDSWWRMMLHVGVSARFCCAGRRVAGGRARCLSVTMQVAALLVGWRVRG